ncbi:C10 family peptidase [Parabacteroides distasonis]|nr:C10 family peptidase [Parabacteroides distasonis]
MRTLFLLISFLTTSWISLFADRVDVVTARKVAEAASSNHLRSSSELTLSYAAAANSEGMLRSASAEEPTDYYVFNIGKNDGFVIVSGLDCTAPILGRADKGFFDPDHVNPALRSMLAYYQRQIGYAEEHGLEPSDEDRAAWLQLKSGISLRSGETLHQTAKWGQNAPYNTYTPVFGETHSPTGCGATATAILLQFFHTTTRCENGVTEQAGQPITYLDHNWNVMTVEKPETDEGKEQVARLMREIGANLNMEYGVGGSISDAMDIPEILKNNYGFNSGAFYYFKEDFSWSTWHDMLRSQLDQYPVVYRGASVNEGHIFVIDGYAEDETYHINWGWDGNNDAWFRLTVMNEVAPYTEGQGMVYNAYPTSLYSEQESVNMQIMKLTYSGSYPIQAETDYQIGVTVYNNSSLLYKDDINLVRFNPETGESITLASTEIKLDIRYSVQVLFNFRLNSELGDNEFLLFTDKDGNLLNALPKVPFGFSKNGAMFNGDDEPENPMPGEEPEVRISTHSLSQDFYQSGLEHVGHGNTSFILFTTGETTEDITVRFELKDFAESWQNKVKFKYQITQPDIKSPNYLKYIDTNITDDGIVDIRIPYTDFEKLQSFRLHLQLLFGQIGSLRYELSVLTGSETLTEQFRMHERTFNVMTPPEATFEKSIMSLNVDVPSTISWQIKDMPEGIVDNELHSSIVVSNLMPEDFVLKHNGEIISFTPFEQGFGCYAGDLILTETLTATTFQTEFELTVGKEVTEADQVHLTIEPGFSIMKNQYLTIVCHAADVTLFKVNCQGLDHILIKNPVDQVGEGETLELQLQASPGYILPKELAVKMGETELTNVYDVNTGTIRIEQVNADIEISGKAEFQPGFKYNVTVDLGTGVHHDLTEVGYEIGKELSFKITADDGYQIPSKLTVTMDGNLLVAGVDYTYENGVFYIGQLLGELIVKAAQQTAKYTLTFELDGLTWEDQTIPNQIELESGSDWEGTLKVIDPVNYKPASYVFVSTQADPNQHWSRANYNSETGKLSLTNIDASLTIRAQAQERSKFTVLPNLTYAKLYQDGATFEWDYSRDKIVEGQSVTLKLVPCSQEYKLPESIILSNGLQELKSDEFTYDSSTGLIVIKHMRCSLSLTAKAICIVESHIIVTPGNKILIIREESEGALPGFKPGSTITVHLDPLGEYERPKTLAKVSMGQNRYLSPDEYTYDASTGFFEVKNVQGHINIQPWPQEGWHYIHASVENIANLSTQPNHVGSVREGETSELFIYALEGYILPQTIQVWSDGSLLNSNEYTYERIGDGQNAKLTIPFVTGEIFFKVSAYKELDNTVTEVSGNTGPIVIESSKELTMSTIETGTVSISQGAEATLTLENRNTVKEFNNEGKTTITGTTNVFITIENLTNSGTMSIKDVELKINENLVNSGDLTIQEGAKVHLTENKTIENNGRFEDLSGTVTEVTGNANLKIGKMDNIDLSTGTNHVLSIEYSSSSQNVTNRWYKKNGNSWQPLPTTRALRSDGLTTLSQAVNEAGNYRCDITVKEGEYETTTLVAYATVSGSAPSDPEEPSEPSDPGTPDEPGTPDNPGIPDNPGTPETPGTPEIPVNPTPTYTVTLPVVEGATVSALGITTLEKGETFKFKIELANGYTAKNMVVKANGIIILPDANGIYVITNVTENIIVTITGIETEATAIESMNSPVTVWVESGQIHVSMTDTAMIKIYHTSGRMVISQTMGTGRYAFTVPNGNYFVQISQGNAVQIVKCLVR